MVMRPILEGEIFAIAFTCIVFYAMQRLQKRTNLLILNPILTSIVIIVTFLSLLRIDIAGYQEHTQIITFFLKPAVVALGVPLYLQLEKIKKLALHIIVSQLIGCIAGVLSVILIAKGLGASKEVLLSLAPKSVTTPIAMEISRTLGGTPSLTAAVVIVTGIFGAVFGYTILKLTGVKDPIAQGIAIGTAAHAVGTSKSIEISPTYGAFSSLGMIVNGVFTAILAPYIIALLEVFVNL